MKILFIGDIVGKPGREAVAKLVPELKKEYGLDFVIANAENAAGGSGITPKVAEELFDSGVNVLTSGDHIWKKREVFEIIDQEVSSHPFRTAEWQVVRRMIHTTGDFNLIDAVRFSPQAISAGIAAFQEGRAIYVDSKMIQSGLSLPRLQSVCKDYDPSHIVCHVSDEDVVREARCARLPRSLFALRKAKPLLGGSLAVFGNSPIALLELNRLILEENIWPAMVIAMPVGFVHVVESKEELMSLDIPYIALAGRRGGSPLAVSVIHALCSIAFTQNHEGSLKPW